MFKLEVNIIEINDIFKLRMPWNDYQKSDIYFRYHNQFKLVGLVGQEACIEDLIDEARFVVNIDYLVKQFPEGIDMESLKLTFERTTDLLDLLEKLIIKYEKSDDPKTQKEIKNIKSKLHKKLQSFL